MSARQTGSRSPRRSSSAAGAESRQASKTSSASSSRSTPVEVDDHPAEAVRRELDLEHLGPLGDQRRLLGDRLLEPDRGGRLPEVAEGAALDLELRVAVELGHRDRVELAHQLARVGDVARHAPSVPHAADVTCVAVHDTKVSDPAPTPSSTTAELTANGRPIGGQTRRSRPRALTQRPPSRHESDDPSGSAPAPPGGRSSDERASEVGTAQPRRLVTNRRHSTWRRAVRDQWAHQPVACSETDPEETAHLPLSARIRTSSVRRRVRV